MKNYIVELRNNKILYLVKRYSGELKYDIESKDMKFFSIENLPENLMDKDLISKYIEILK